MGNSASNLPYTIGDALFESEDGWSVHDGTTKASGDAVTVFKANKPALAKSTYRSVKGALSKMNPAHHHFTYSKKLRHPQILTVLASLDTDNPNADPALDKVSTTSGDFIIVTESCRPLQQWLDSRPTNDELAWGLQCAVQALSFLHTSAALSHGNLHPSSWFVTPGGDVKLWDFSLATPVGIGDGSGGPTPHFRDYEGVLTPQPYRSPERIQASWNGIATSGVHCMDSYGLGILINEFYKGKIPAPLQKAVQRLQTPSLKMRPRLAPLLRCPVFDTTYATLQSKLQQLTIAPVEEKLSFWQSLQVEMIHPKVSEYKLLPLIVASITTICSSDAMLSQDLYRREVLAMLAPLFYISEKLLPQDQAGKHLTPLCSLLFAVKDRAVRGALLAKTPLLVTHLSKNDLNANVFEPLCSGFSDGSEALRELTLKACLVLIPCLNPPNLEKLSRYLVRLQSDTSTNIRTHALAVIPQIAPHLSPIPREKLLLPAFIRAFKDPHTPCRMAALTATAESKELFVLSEMADKVLPALCPLTMDESADVRNQTFAVIDQFLGALRKNHSEKSVGDVGHTNVRTVEPVQIPTVLTTAAPSSGSYLSSMTSWMAPSTQQEAQAPAAGNVADAATNHRVWTATTTTVNHQAPRPAPEPSFSSLSIGGGAASRTSGWDDDDDEMDFGATTSAEDDPFASLGMKTSSAGLRSATRSKSSGGGKLIMPTRKAKAEVKKLSMDNDGSGDGWDDF